MEILLTLINNNLIFLLLLATTTVTTSPSRARAAKASPLFPARLLRARDAARGA